MGNHGSPVYVFFIFNTSVKLELTAADNYIPRVLVYLEWFKTKNLGVLEWPSQSPELKTEARIEKLTFTCSLHLIWQSLNNSAWKEIQNISRSRRAKLRDTYCGTGICRNLVPLRISQSLRNKQMSAFFVCIINNNKKKTFNTGNFEWYIC